MNQPDRQPGTPADAAANAQTRDASSGDRKVAVFLFPLFVTLAQFERGKGSPLTEEEVLEIRDQTSCLMMSEVQAEKFYASVEAQFPYPRLDPERIWEEWQQARAYVEWPDEDLPHNDHDSAPRAH